MKIIVLDGGIANPGDLDWNSLSKLGELTVYDNSANDEIIQRIGTAEIAIGNKTVFSRRVIEACPKLKFIGLLATGYNLVDLNAAAEKGIVVCNAPNYGTPGVAQHTIALLLEICNQIGSHSKLVHQGAWQQNGNWCFWRSPLTELCGKTFGAVGFGAIGKATACIAKALGMNILASGSRPTPEGKALAEYVPFDTLLAKSDVVSLHCPLLPSTEGIINEETLQKMKNGVILLNTARGGLVVEDALAKALDSGKVSAAGLDVVGIEPITENSPLLHAKNCFITPHIAWAAKDTRARLLEIVAANLQGFLEGKPINVVNPSL